MFFKIMDTIPDKALTFEVIDEQFPDVLLTTAILVPELSRLVHGQSIRYPHLIQSPSH